MSKLGSLLDRRLSGGLERPDLRWHGHLGLAAQELGTLGLRGSEGVGFSNLQKTFATKRWWPAYAEAGDRFFRFLPGFLVWQLWEVTLGTWRRVQRGFLPRPV